MPHVGADVDDGFWLQLLDVDDRFEILVTD